MAKDLRYTRNIGIMAHIDAGKTTTSERILFYTGITHRIGEVHDGAATMDWMAQEQERGITITAKNCAFIWKDTKINLLDTPGHADFGGEVERSLMMVDGILLLVDASEGPLPQTRFVLTKAMEQRLKIAVVINKIDRPDERIDEVKHEIEELFLELASMLNIEDFDLDIPIIYSSARAGWATHDPKVVRTDINPILDLMVSDFFPSPRISEGPELQLLVTNLSYSPYLGPLAIGRIQRGTIKKGTSYTLCDVDKKNKASKITAIQEFSALAITEVESADAGEIVIVAGYEGAKIGDTIVSTSKIEPLPRINVEPPTVGVQVSVSTSPMSGQEGEYLTSRKLEEFLQDSIKTNVALQYEGTDDPKVFILKGRGELQLAIVFEQLRRKGFELMVGRPQVLFQTDENGEKLEPFEKVVLDIPIDFLSCL